MPVDAKTTVADDSEVFAIDAGPVHFHPTLISIAVRRTAGALTAATSLCLKGITVHGSANRDDDDRERAIATATLDAVRDMLPDGVRVESAQVVTLPGRKVAVTVLEFPDDKGRTRPLVGSALVTGEVEDALALSVLAALDRRFNDEENS